MVTLDIRYEMDLEEWIQQNASKTVKGLQSHSKDSKGIVYTSSGIPVGDSKTVASLRDE